MIDKKIIEIYCLSYSSIVLSRIFYSIFINYLLLESGIVYGFGYNEDGELGIGNTTNQTIPQEIIYFKNIPISKIYCGSFHSFAISRDSNKVYCWGYNDKGQLGLGDKNNRIIPEEHKYLKNGKSIIQCSLGYKHSIILIEKPHNLSFIIQLKRKDFYDIKFKYK